MLTTERSVEAWSACAPSVRWTSLRSTPLGAPKYDNLNLAGGLSGYIVVFRGELAKCLSIREQGIAETGVERGPRVGM